MMTRAQRVGREMRRQLGLQGEVDAEAVANRLGCEVVTWPLLTLEEMASGDAIAVAKRLDPSWRRWVVAHALGHKVLHPGNHAWMRARTQLGHRLEREAEEFAGALLMDGREVAERRLLYSWEVAEYFGVPDELVRLQMPLAIE